MTEPTKRHADSIPNFAAAHGLGRSTIYAEIKRGNLRATKIGRRTVIFETDGESWRASKRTA